MMYTIPYKNTVCKKEYLKDLIEACLQNNDNECDPVQVDDTVEYLPNSIQLHLCNIS